jgi:peptidoglycan/LPS O-acetylase OafA/YrhL
MTPPVNRRRVLRPVLLASSTLLLLALAWAALSGAVRQLPRSSTAGQQVETAVQLLCGVLSLLVPVTAFRWRRSARAVRTAWTTSLVIAAGLSPLVWGPPMPLLALLFAAAAYAGALAVLRALRIGSDPSDR